MGVAVDHAGNLLIADYGNNRVRVVAERTGTFYGKPMTAGDIYTVAGHGPHGTGMGGFSGDGGQGAARPAGGRSGGSRRELADR
jgi:NHL repeat